MLYINAKTPFYHYESGKKTFAEFLVNKLVNVRFLSMKVSYHRISVSVKFRITNGFR